MCERQVTYWHTTLIVQNFISREGSVSFFHSSNCGFWPTFETTNRIYIVWHFNIFDARQNGNIFSELHKLTNFYFVPKQSRCFLDKINKNLSKIFGPKLREIEFVRFKNQKVLQQHFQQHRQQQHLAGEIVNSFMKDDNCCWLRKIDKMLLMRIASVNNSMWDVNQLDSIKESIRINRIFFPQCDINGMVHSLGNLTLVVSIFNNSI